jgi:hypothetical protein
MRWSLVVFLVAAGCDAGGVGGDDGGGSTAAHEFCVDETNRLRELNGRAPVAWSAELEAYANEGAEYDHARSPHDHFGDTQGGGIAFGENECPHWDLSFGGGDMVELMRACIDAFYSEGPGGGHYEIMLSNDYGTLGCGIYQEGTDVTIIQDYGQ